MRDAVVDGFGSFKHLGFSNVPSHRTVHSPQHFVSIEMQLPQPSDQQQSALATIPP